jgi:hypothetical protein
MTEQFIHELNRSNFFYENIVTLAYTQFGINEMFSRGLFIAAMKLFPNVHDRSNYFNSLGFPNDVIDQLNRTRTFTPKIFVPEFQTKDQTRGLRMDVETSAIRFYQDNKGITDKNIELTHMTIIVAWEKILPYNLPDGPILQFFRHVRNAAAHNGKFHFTGKAINPVTGELGKAAQWQHFEIKAAMQDQPLLVTTKIDQNGFMDQGDLVEFLLEFEQHYPGIKSI